MRQKLLPQVLLTLLLSVSSSRDDALLQLPSDDVECFLQWRSKEDCPQTMCLDLTMDLPTFWGEFQFLLTCPMILMNQTRNWDTRKKNLPTKRDLPKFPTIRRSNVEAMFLLQGPLLQKRLHLTRIQ